MMDPNEVLKNARAALAHIRASYGDYDGLSVQVDALVDAFEALDKWLTNGGCIPDEWDKGFERTCAPQGERKKR